MFKRDLVAWMNLLTVATLLLAKTAVGQPSSIADSSCHLRMNICQADSFYEPFDPFACWDLYSGSLICDTGFRFTGEFIVPQDNKDSISISITDPNHKEVLLERFPPLVPSKYVLSFPIVDCPGFYNVQIALGKEPFAFAIIPLQKPPTPASAKIAEGSPVVGGLVGTWEKTYNQTVVPRTQSPRKSQTVDTVVERVVLRIDSCLFTIVWSAYNTARGEVVHRYRGSVLLDTDALKFFDPLLGQSYCVFRAQTMGDSLSLSGLHEMIGDLPASSLRPMPNSVSLVLEGVYRRVGSK
jgi:hypothetical protein